MFDYLMNAYLDYVNNFLTVEAYADYHHLTLAAARHLIEAGKECHAFNVTLHAA